LVSRIVGRAEREGVAVIENENANRVLQQTIKRRLPDLDSRLKAAKKALAELESVNAELRTTVASQSEALKTARTTLHNQRSDIERLRVALESGSGAGVRGLGKADARTLAESQRLSAELSKTQEELERAKTGAQENMLLRRELTRLTSQILAVARAQGGAPIPQRMVMEVTQTYTEFGDMPEPQAPEPEPEPEWHKAHAGNGSAREPEMAETVLAVDAVAAGMGRATANEELAAPAEEEAESEAEEPKGPLAKRFAARREKRRARKAGGGGSLSDRLRGLVADRAET
jgi:uncharacterized coiled-coil protein SlyX